MTRPEDWGSNFPEDAAAFERAHADYDPIDHKTELAIEELAELAAFHARRRNR
ncbi:MAG: hypothetical protein ACRDQA_02905 [Nocardioidaceae bacterium]